ncbi:YdaU family protein [Shinella daejeonensis]|uniref:YdaU family protein n=1 Tax=Shinella daejeonensis TaxID=659017 RepID=UPI0020C77A55|nr:YdaU family protein [Shinella daejeonensis]
MPPEYVPDYRHCLLPYVQWFQDDFLGGIRGMKALEVGIYTVLLNEMYNRGVALDQPDERLARMCGTDTRTFRKVVDMLVDDEKIVRLNCGLWNVRCENAFSNRAKMLKQQSFAGKASAEKRRKNKEPDQHPFSERSTDVQPISEAQIVVKEEPIGSSKKRGFRLPDDWQPDRSFGENEGFTDPEIDREADRFRDHWRQQPGQKGVKLDWTAAWRNWIRKSADDRKARKSGTGRGTPRADDELTNDFLFGGRR